MKTKIIKKFNKPPPKAFNNEYPTSHYQFRNPMLIYTTSKIVRDVNADNLYDVIYMITPTFQSNIALFGDLGIKEENVYKPVKGSLEQVIAAVENERNEWEQYLAEMEVILDIIIDRKSNNINGWA